MAGSALACPSCRSPWPEDPAQLVALTWCPYCQRNLQVAVFPAFSRPLARGATPEAIVVEGEAACFYHPQKRAVVPCGSCGRFLCALCDLDLNGQHLCPTCLETGQRKGKLAELDTQRTIYDSAALMLAVVGPFITCLWGTVLTALTVIGLVIYGWKKPGSLVARTRVRAIVALALALLELAGWAFMVISIITSA